MNIRLLVKLSKLQYRTLFQPDHFTIYQLAIVNLEKNKISKCLSDVLASFVIILMLLLAMTKIFLA